MQTQVDRALEALEMQHAEDPERAELLRRTRRFKSSWLELAEALANAKQQKTWERWGYDSFEAYAKGELKLRPDTVEKLTGSYMFLHKRAPEVLRRDPLDTPLPSFQAIDFLRRAEERAEEDDSVPNETMVDIRKRVLDEGVPVATVARLYKDTLFPVSEGERKDKDRTTIKQLATKLRDLLAETNAVPKKVSADVREKLDAIIELVAESAKAA